MSRLSALRKKMGYQTNVPRCETCKHFKPPYIYLTTNSKTTRSHPLCKIGDFTVAPTACCDKWQGKNGDVLTEIGRAA